MKREVTSIDFGQWMQAKRKSLHMKQSMLAEKVNCSTGTISRWETGELFPPLDMADKIVTALGGELIVREHGINKGRTKRSNIQSNSTTANKE